MSCAPVGGSPSLCEGYRLPTEAEWEYAARGGESFPFAGSADAAEVGWTAANAASATHAVAQRTPNGWGLFDMTGNVWEWCGDSWDGAAPYPSSAAVDPDVSVGALKTRRGGAWNSIGRLARVAYRGYGGPATRGTHVGFRLVRTAP